MNARLISNAALWNLHCAQGRRDAVCQWLTANHLDPLAVVNTYDVVVEDAEGGGQQIRCHVIEKSAAGVEERIVPLVVPPPPDWPVYAVPGSPRAEP